MAMARDMARDFEDHCWKDVVDDEILEIYEPYRRELKVGRNPAVLAIDLYNKAYQGGARPVREANRQFPGSCGEHAWNALEPTRKLLSAARRAGIPVIYKERASGFFGTPLVAHLRKLGVESLIVCGESTSGCVRASTVDAYSYAFHNVVVEECTFDRSLLSHKVNLFDLHHKYADVMHLDEVVAHLDGLARGRNAA